MRRHFGVGLVLAAVVAVAGVLPAGASTIRYSNTPIAAWRANGVGYASLVVGNTVYIGGSFSSVTNPSGSSTVSRANLAAFDVSTGALVTTFRADTNGTVRALAADGSRLFVGGQFTKLNGSSRSRFAAVDLTTGALESLRADASSNVYALAVGGGRVYLGGSFSKVNGSGRSRLASVQISNGTLTTFNPSANATVKALAASADGGAVYAGGDFTTVAGTSRPYLARLSASGGIVNTNWSRVDTPVFAISLRPDGSRLAVALAGYTNSGAYYNTSSGARLWSHRCDGDAQAVAVIDDSVLVGHHEGCNGDKAVRLVSYNASSGSRDTSFRPTFDRFYGAWAMSATSSVLAIAGDFTKISGVKAQGFALFRKA